MFCASERNGLSGLSSLGHPRVPRGTFGACRVRLLVWDRARSTVLPQSALQQIAHPPDLVLMKQWTFIDRLGATRRRPIVSGCGMDGFRTNPSAVNCRFAVPVYDTGSSGECPCLDGPAAGFIHTLIVDSPQLPSHGFVFGSPCLEFARIPAGLVLQERAYDPTIMQ
jgi:hypothetical protein